MNLSEVSEDTREAMTFAFLSSIENLKYENLDQLHSLFSEFLEKYPTNFEQFCKQTKGRSNWRCWASTKPTLSPGFITKSIEDDRDLTQKMKEFLDKHNAPKSKSPSLSEILGDVARVLANDVFMFEDAVDDLFSIGLFGKWDDMREKLARMEEKRLNELKTGIKKELGIIIGEINKHLKDDNCQVVTFSTEVFNNYKQALKQHLCVDDFMVLQKTYSKVLSLGIQSNLSDVNKRKLEETKTSIEKAITLLDKEGECLDFEDVVNKLLNSKGKRKYLKPIK
jgi:hypothetical protein